MKELFPSKWVNDNDFRAKPHEGVVYGYDCKNYGGKYCRKPNI